MDFDKWDDPNFSNLAISNVAETNDTDSIHLDLSYWKVDLLYALPSVTTSKQTCTTATTSTNKTRKFVPFTTMG